MLKKFLFLFPLVISVYSYAQEVEQDEADVEEVVTVGSQIKGATITGLLPVTVITNEEIDQMGIESGSDLIESIISQGENTLNEDQDSTVFSARGDNSGFNLRNFGVGNTLTLLNGRRMVNTAGYNTDFVGGSVVPVKSVNANEIPVGSVARVEVLRDGASAIYGADAVAGVVNTVLRDDYDGLTVRTKFTAFDHFAEENSQLNITFGKDLADGVTNINASYTYYDGGAKFAREDPRWLAGNAMLNEYIDFWNLIPGGADYSDDGSSNPYTNASSQTPWGRWIPLDGHETAWTIYPIDITAYPLGMLGTDGEPLMYDRRSKCQEVSAIGIGPDGAGVSPLNLCIEDSTSSNRINWNHDRQAYSSKDRHNLFIYINSEFMGYETFSEIGYYTAKNTRQLYGSSTLGTLAVSKTQSLIIPETNPYLRKIFDYYMACQDDSISSNLNYTTTPDNCTLGGSSSSKSDLFNDSYSTYGPMAAGYFRFPNLRTNTTELETIRLLQGIRGSFNNWDWESAILYSKATSDDYTDGRVAMDLLDYGLSKTDETAINLFAGGMEGMNLEQALITVKRSQETDLSMIDFKMTNANIGDIGAGPIAMLVGAEIRNESFDDDLDDRLDGTIQWYDQTVCTAGEGRAYDAATNSITYTVAPVCSSDITPTYVERGKGNSDQTFGSEEGTVPFASAVAMSSPQPGSSGDRTTSSLFVELQIPVLENLDAQVAIRHESFSDVNSATVGKIALGYYVNPTLSFRGSASTTYRAPNLITVNSPYIPRNSSYTDALGSYLGNGFDVGAINPDTGTLYPEDEEQVYWDITAYKLAASVGNPDLESEEAVNKSFGFIYTPSDNLIITVDKWSIAKEKTIGIFGAENNSAYDLLLRLDGSCEGNSAVIRGNAPSQAEWDQYFPDTNLCPAGQILRIEDPFMNLDDRYISGTDFSLFFDKETSWGDFGFRYQSSILDKFTQTSSGPAAEIVAADEAGLFANTSVDVTGFESLLGVNAVHKKKGFYSFSFKRGDYTTTIRTNFKSGFEYPSSSKSAGTSGTYWEECYQCDSPVTLTDSVYWLRAMSTTDLSVAYKTKLKGNRLNARFTVKNIFDERAPTVDKTYGYWMGAHNDFGTYYNLDLKLRF